ncbi:hypothetical protein KDH83_12930 [Achromobacter sp. Marseille-Q0513]|uniref:hypothetical protein n=1 Tax=Achromobacter sp. Marseille-Q0513 TaxID=2829161 RepID=UPI001B9CB75E|nr:hypothetical protein [Achromobacter sp. Marseille-Q0513]MBR8654198.1 hypothetical protein [Achromobacter sp. Marseille-Q0513]
MSGPLDMRGHIDGVFGSRAVTVKAYAEGHYDDDGIWFAGAPIEETYTANIQPLNDREAENLMRAGVRLLDPRKLYINSGDLEKFKLTYDLEFLGALWKIVRSDIRPWRSYAKVVVSRYDDQAEPNSPNVDAP